MDEYEYRYLSLCDGYLENNELWFSNCNFNALCKVNLDTLDVKVITTFIRREKWKKALHRKIIEFNNFFYFIPNCGNEIDIINRTTGEQTFAIIPEEYLQNSQYCVAEAMRVADKIWLFSVYAQQPVIVYDINKNEFTKEEKLSYKLNEFNGVVFTYESVCKGRDCFWMTILRSNCVISMDWKTKEVKEYRLNIDNLYSINCSGTKIWLGTWNSERVAIWNSETNELNGIKMDSAGVYVDSFFKPIVIENSAYILLGPDANKTACFRKNDKNIIYIFSDNKVNADSELLSLYECIYNDRLFIFPYKMKCLISLDLMSKDVKSDKFKISEPFVLENYYKEYKIPFLKQESDKGVLYETSGLGLEELGAIIDIYRKENIEKNNGQAGRTIWNDRNIRGV